MSYGQPGYNGGRTGHGWGTEEGIPNPPRTQEASPGNCGPRQGPQVESVCGMFWAWEDHGKMLNSPGHDEDEGPGGQPVERKVI